MQAYYNTLYCFELLSIPLYFKSVKVWALLTWQLLCENAGRVGGEMPYFHGFHFWRISISRRISIAGWLVAEVKPGKHSQCPAHSALTLYTVSTQYRVCRQCTARATVHCKGHCTLYTAQYTVYTRQCEGHCIRTVKTTSGHYTQCTNTVHNTHTLQTICNNLYAAQCAQCAVHMHLAMSILEMIVVEEFK